MTRIIDADYSIIYLFPPKLEDWVPPQHPARFIRAFVDQMDLDACGFSTLEGKGTARVGRPHFSRKMLLKGVLYGYFHRLRSYRALERATMNDLGMIWLLGNHRIDHNTFWSFWNENRDAIKKLLKKSVKYALKLNMVGLVLQAVDGTKIQADINKSKALHKADLIKLLKRAKKSVDQLMSGLDSSQDEAPYQLPEEVQQLLAEKNQFIAELEKKVELLEELGKEHHSETDPDSEMMRGRHGIEFSHNAQAVADEKSGIIVACDVTDDVTDHDQLVPMLDQATENQGEKADSSLGDNGYCSGEQLEEAEAAGYNVLLNPGPTNKATKRGIFDKSMFEYDETIDAYRCPAGELLEFAFVENKGRTKKIQFRVYQGKACKGCALRAKCTKAKRGGRRIRQHPLSDVIQRNAERARKDAAVLKRRKTIIEPAFGIIKRNYGFMRWTVRGLEKVQTQWAVVCTIFNLRKIYKAICNNGLSDTATNVPLREVIPLV